MAAKKETNRTQRAPADQAATIEAMLQNILVTALQSYGDQVRRLNADDACTTYQALTAAQKNTINTSLGGKSPCP